MPSDRTHSGDAGTRVPGTDKITVLEFHCKLCGGVFRDEIQHACPASATTTIPIVFNELRAAPSTGAPDHE